MSNLIIKRLNCIKLLQLKLLIRRSDEIRYPWSHTILGQPSDCNSIFCKSYFKNKIIIFGLKFELIFMHECMYRGNVK